jgi:hypothetical protein
MATRPNLGRPKTRVHNGIRPLQPFYSRCSFSLSALSIRSNNDRRTTTTTDTEHFALSGTRRTTFWFNSRVCRETLGHGISPTPPPSFDLNSPVNSLTTLTLSLLFCRLEPPRTSYKKRSRLFNQSPQSLSSPIISFSTRQTEGPHTYTRSTRHRPYLASTFNPPDGRRATDYGLRLHARTGSLVCATPVLLAIFISSTSECGIILHLAWPLRMATTMARSEGARSKDGAREGE